MQGSVEGTEAMTGLSLRDFLSNPEDIFWPMMVGSIPCAIVIWVLVYHIMRDVVSRYQERRRRRLARKTMKDFQDSA